MMVRQEHGARQQAGDELLDTLAGRLGCNYLSDLKSPQHKAAVAEIVATIDAQRYPLAQWNEALAYLCGQNAHSDAQSAKEALKQALGQHE